MDNVAQKGAQGVTVTVERNSPHSASGVWMGCRVKDLVRKGRDLERLVRARAV